LLPLRFGPLISQGPIGVEKKKRGRTCAREEIGGKTPEVVSDRDPEAEEHVLGKTGKPLRRGGGRSLVGLHRLKGKEMTVLLLKEPRSKGRRKQSGGNQMEEKIWQKQDLGQSTTTSQAGEENLTFWGGSH